MSRRLSRLVSTIFGLIYSIAATSTANAQEAPQPLELVRGLRENGLPDLALEYLEKTEKTPNLPDSIKELIPLERARTRLELASHETDDGKRENAAKLAKSDFEAFIKANPTHPRLSEARVAVARITFIQGRMYMTRAVRESEEGDIKGELARARPYFKDAVKAFSDAADEIEKQAAAEPNAARKKEITRDAYQARLDQAIAQFHVGETYNKPSGKEVDDRFAAYKEARTQFIKLGSADLTMPQCWIARAWIIECSTIMPEPIEADKAREAFYLEVRKRPTDPAALAGKRMADFFEIRAKLGLVGKDSPLTDFQKLRALCATWLSINKTLRPTPEHYAINYYHATLLFEEAIVRSTGKDGKPLKPLPKEAAPLLREAEREFQRLADSENDYSARANRRRMQAIRLIVGDADKPPAAYTTFSELHMAALVQNAKINDLKDEKDKGQQFKKLIALLEREQEVVVPRENAREAQTGQLMLLRAYMDSGRPQSAAIMAEHLARTARSGSLIAKAGYNAILAYLASAATIDPTNTADRKADQDRAAAMAMYLEKVVPDDPVTDAARYHLAVLLGRDGRTYEQFEVLHRISSRFVLVSYARLIQGGAAYELLRARPATEKPLIPDAKKAEVFRIALSDLNAVLPPPPNSKADDAVAYIRLQLQIAQLHLTNRQDGYPFAEKTATEAKASIATYANLQGDDKKAQALELNLRAELIRIDSIYGLARLEVDANKYKEAADRLAGVLADAVREGSVSKKVAGDTALSGNTTLVDLARRVDDARLDRVVGLALNCRVREGDLVKAGELLKLIDDLGGDITRSTAAIYRLVGAIKPQLEALHNEKKDAAAKKLSADVAALIGQFASKPSLAPEVNYNLGRAFKEIGEYSKAVEQLSKIEKPADPAFTSGTAPANETEELKAERLKKETILRDKASLYRGAQLEMIRAHRQDNKFDKAEALLEAALGKDPEGYIKKADGPNKNWGHRFVEFRRERFLVLEAKASATADPKTGTPLYVEALRGWEKLVQEYKQVITTTPKTVVTQEQKDERKRLVDTVLKPRYHEAFYQAQRCRTLALLYDSKNKPPATREKGMTSVANTLINLEKGTPDLPEDIKLKYIALVAENPPLMTEYQKLGGSVFLAAPVTATNPGAPPVK